MGLSEAIVEKDLWVCYLLDHLFHRSEFKDSIIFKGGTSLSKAYGLIEPWEERINGGRGAGRHDGNTRRPRG